MFETLVLHPLTASQLKAFAERPSHALLLHGPAGSGKQSLAEELARELLGADSIDGHPYVRYIRPIDGKAISIEAVRELEKFLSLKVPGKGDVRRVVLVEGADSMGHEAQNALLKTLEEPPTDTVLILQAANLEALLPTIHSRVSSIAVKRPGREAITAYFGQSGHSAAAIERAFQLSGGFPGLLSALLNSEDHPLVPATELARQFLAQSTFERLASVDQLGKNKPLTIDMLFILQQMAHIRLQTSTGDQAKNWQKIMASSYEASEQLSKNGQPKLVLTRLMLNLS